jgi:hypothetical protein
MKIAVFWVIAPCSLLDVYRRFRGACCRHHQGNVWRMDIAGTYETSVNLYQSARRNSPDDSHLDIHDVFGVKPIPETSCAGTLNINQTVDSVQRSRFLSPFVRRLVCLHWEKFRQVAAKLSL